MRRTILLVSDRIKTLSALFKLLSPEYDVLVAKCTEAVERDFSDKTVDMIIFNMDIEGGKGFDFLDRLNKSSRYGQVPVLIIISMMNEELREYTRDGRVLDFILKPVDTSLLLNRIRNYFVIQEHGTSNTVQ